MTADVSVIGRKWRPGRHHPQIVYAMQGDEPANEDMMLAVFWDERTAGFVIEQHNRWLGYQGRRVTG
jgi:hypothetical protein